MEDGKSKAKKIAVIGAGAAGMMLAATILEEISNLAPHIQIQIDLFDKNKVMGTKVAISGGGRCNVTTGINDEKLLFSKYVRGSKFLKPAMLNFPPTKVMDWFAAHDLPLKVESDLRVFPISDNGKDVVAVFTKIFNDPRIRIHFTEPIKDVTLDHDGSEFKLTSSVAEYSADIVAITSGGNAYRHTGSTGDGYAFAQSFAHATTKLGPSLNSFETTDTWMHELKGLSLPNAALVSLTHAGKVLINGPMVFTHFGLSGPMVFAFSAHTAFETISPQQPLSARLILVAEKNQIYWEEKFTQNPNRPGTKLIINILKEELPARLASQLLTIAKIPQDRIIARLSKHERLSLIKLLTEGISITLKSRRPGDEFVTAGGIDVANVNWKTLESKLTPNLFFAGEVLDIDGRTGGFNLQSAWATGRLAGISILKNLYRT